MAEPITNVLGVVGMKTRGAYNSETSYEKLNVVTYNGSSYCAKMATQGNLPTNETYWDLIAEKGDKGDTGNDGYTPVKGTDYYTAEDKSELEATLSSDVTSEVTDQLEDLTSAAPLAVSSTSGMTDTTRIYVNTTDGHWYWYNGTAWTDGGVYQATQLDDNEVDINNLKEYIQNAIDLNTVEYTTTSGYYINTSGSKSPSSGFYYSSPFSLKKDETLYLKCYMGGSGSPISKYNGEGVNNTVLVTGISGDVHEFTYKAMEDIQVQIAYNGAYPVTVYKILNSDLNKYIGLIDNFNYVTGHYIHTDGHEATQQFYNRSEPIAVEKGQLISFTGYVGTSACAIAKYNGEGNRYSCLVAGEGQNKEYDYVADENMSIVVSYDKDTTPSLVIKFSNESIVSLMSKNDLNSKTNILSMYSNITCCGDSLTYSLVYTGNGSRQAYVTYPETLQRRTGATVENLGYSGDNATQWWDRFNGQITQKTNQLAIIYLGTNGGLTDTIDTDCVGNDYTQYADTHTGNYGKIIKKFLDTGAKVILVKIYSDAGVTVNPIIEKFGTRFNVNVIDNPRLDDNVYHYYPNLSGTNWLHYNDLGYSVFTDQLISNVNNLSNESKAKLLPN